MQISKLRLLASITALGAIALGSTPALASESFPAAIQEAAGMPCTPSCTLCHGVDPGTATTFQNKQLGKALFLQNGMAVPPGDNAALKANYAFFAMQDANKAVVEDLKNGIDPETKAELCSNNVTYGCGAHIASKAPPRDWSPVLWIAGAVVAGAWLRRREPRAG